MKKVLSWIRESRLASCLFPIILLAIICLAFGITTKGRFFMPNNLKTMLNQSLVTGTLAVGATFLFGTGNINLAMGGTTALAAVFGALVYGATESVLLMLLVCTLSGVALSYVSSLAAQVTRMPLITITMVTMMLYPAIQQWVLGIQTLQVPYAVYSGLQQKQVPILVFLLFLVLCLFLFYFTAFGRKVSFLGDNALCAELTGLSKNRIIDLAFCVAGVGCGLAAFLTILRSGSVSVNTMTSGNLDCVLAIVLGGMPLFGGYKTMPHAGILGALVLVTLNNGLLMVGVPAAAIQAVRAVIFLVLIVIAWKRPPVIPGRD